jgi:hypothetical protein
MNHNARVSPAYMARPWRNRSRNNPIPVAAPHPESTPLVSAVPLLPLEIPGDPDLALRFDSLAQRWREETEFASAPSALFMHQAYQEIIGLGPAVLPLVLRDLGETRDHWFWALRSITAENPVPPEERGKVERMVERWLEWGRAKGLL